MDLLGIVLCLACVSRLFYYSKAISYTHSYRERGKPNDKKQQNEISSITLLLFVGKPTCLVTCFSRGTREPV